MFKFNEGAGPVNGSAEDGGSTSVSLTAPQQLEIQAIENKLTKMGFEVVLRILSSADTQERADDHMRHFLAAFQQYSTINLNSLVTIPAEDKLEELNKFSQRVYDNDNRIILNIEEAATLYHYPSSAIATPNISWVYSRKGEPPANLPTKDATFIGHTVYRSRPVKFGIMNGDDRLRHMYLIGKSGVGKSTLFNSMLIQDIHNGAGVGLLDPHGETVENLLEYIPDNRVDDVVYFDPSDVDHPIGLNLLEIDDPSQKNLLASGLLAAIKQHFEYSWGPRLEYLLNYAILTLLDVPGTTMMGVVRLLTDVNYQKFILHHVKDPAVIDFWEKEYKDFKGNQKLVTEAVAPIQNKVNRFLASTTIRNILGQKKSTLDMWDAMNNNKIILMNLSKGKIGQDNANLLGALLVSRIQFYALQRAKLKPEERVPFYLYVDEFQNFATGSFEEILSESRKYKLGLYLTHQFTAQLPEELLKAVYGNVGTIATFSVGAPDAHAMGQEFAPYFEAEDIISLQRFQIYIKLMINGMTSLPFSAEILRPWEEDFPIKKTNNRDRAIEASRQKYGTDRQYVEDKIAKWFQTPFDKGLAISQENKRKEINE
jgi:GTPase SAR1 family protein